MLLAINIFNVKAQFTNITYLNSSLEQITIDSFHFNMSFRTYCTDPLTLIDTIRYFPNDSSMVFNYKVIDHVICNGVGLFSNYGTQPLGKVPGCVNNITINFEEYKLVNGNYELIRPHAWDTTHFIHQRNCVVNGVTDLGNLRLKVTPNPAHKFIHLQSPQKIENISIYNTNGKQVLYKNDLDATNNTLNIEHLPHGIYFYIANTTKGRLNGKFIKQ